MQRVATHYPLLTLLQLRFDGFGEVVETGEALEFLDDFAVATDEKAGWITEQAAELVGDFVAAEDDWIVHRKLLTVHGEAFLGEEADHRAFAVFVPSNAQHGEAFRGVFLLHFDEPGNLDVAGLAPGSPEIDEDDTALVLCERDIIAVKIFEFDFGGGLAVNLWLGLLGVFHHVSNFSARGLVREISCDDQDKHGEDDQEHFFHCESSRFHYTRKCCCAPGCQPGAHLMWRMSDRVQATGRCYSRS